MRSATVAGFVVVGWRSPTLRRPTVAWVPVLLAALAMFVVGVLDDRLQLSPLAKLVASLAIGAFLVFALAGAEPDGALPPSYTLVGTIWFAGICHALNLLDNMDGLAAGVALIAAVFLAVAARRRRSARRWSSLLAALAGALLGFLYWNRPPARLFMGDCGSLFIGALLAGASLVPIFNARVAFVSPAVLVVLILVVPLFDTGVRAGAAAAGRPQGEQGRHRSRVASARVARLLRAQRRPHPVPARPDRRADGVGRCRRGARSSRCCRSWRCSACS